MSPNLSTFPRCCLDEKHWCERDYWYNEFIHKLKRIQKQKRKIKHSSHGKVYITIDELLGIDKNEEKS